MSENEHDRVKEKADFAAVQPSLDQLERRWLTGALQRIHPELHWVVGMEG